MFKRLTLGLAGLAVSVNVTAARVWEAAICPGAWAVILRTGKPAACGWTVRRAAGPANEWGDER